MFDLVLEGAKLAVRLMTPSPYDIIEKKKQALREFDEKMRRELGEGWSLETKREVHSAKPTKPKDTSEEDDPVDLVLKAINMLKKARDKAGCPVVRDVIDELLLTIEERLSYRISYSTSSKLLDKIAEVIEEEGIDDWESLSEEDRARVIEKVKQRL